MPTIDDVARVAGVSKGTVSKVLKNFADICFVSKLKKEKYNELSNNK